MKHIINIVLILLGLFLMVYLLGSFTQVSLDISKWSEGVRVTTILAYSLISLFGIGGYVAYNVD